MKEGIPMSERAKISQKTAILLERVRRFGVADDVILASKITGDITPLKIAEEEYYHYDEFFTYAEEHGEDLEAAIKNGYQMKFNTNGGIQTWLKERFGLEADRDYLFSPGKFTQLKLSVEQADILFSVLSGNWVMLISADGHEYVADDYDFADVEENVIDVQLIVRSEYK
ncbi:hypothetical protein RRV45_20020 [Bacillus sp. DTU_2020_1000418_1_SI_GHA_SEK_038]|uniref:hypothetical protein n=1 Tax=Bacillus sp. DTU_2020_1000418_1_SI_GHA_SEK_038 TaxID=3077585 RepID=UPI0028E42E7C|nr:hypothetical protein [Bacillus sp. DTU_2020_1000418_1_SI_GHA_SEK_038]WNS75138.1 hypothetical protein RRV45_20020 [Bacillus sp. DTU_2020_1000418_1_SI_GHA_SEK_038]